MQNKPYFFFWKQGFPKGGGSDIWGKFPKNPVFIFWVVSLSSSFEVRAVAVEAVECNQAKRWQPVSGAPSRPTVVSNSGCLKGCRPVWLGFSWSVPRPAGRPIKCEEGPVLAEWNRGTNAVHPSDSLDIP